MIQILKRKTLIHFGFILVLFLSFCQHRQSQTKNLHVIFLDKSELPSLTPSFFFFFPQHFSPDYQLSSKEDSDIQTKFQVQQTFNNPAHIDSPLKGHPFFEGFEGRHSILNLSGTLEICDKDLPCQTHSFKFSQKLFAFGPTLQEPFRDSQFHLLTKLFSLTREKIEQFYVNYD
jgi:hypothetical protein